MRIAYKNIIDDIASSAITPSSVVFPIANIKEQRLSIRWKSDSATTQSIVFDLNPISTALTSINTIAILGHNIITGTGITVEANTTDSWGTPAFSTSMTVIESGAILNFLSSSQLYRYWKFSFSGQGNLEIGRIWLGEYITIMPSCLIGFTVTKMRSDNVEHNRGRQKFANIGIGWRKFEMEFPPTGEDTIRIVSGLFDYVGNHSSFIFCNFDSLRDYILVEPCYVSINNDKLDFTNTNNMKFNWSLELEEEL